MRIIVQTKRFSAANFIYSLICEDLNVYSISNRNLLACCVELSIYAYAKEGEEALERKNNVLLKKNGY